MKTLTLEKFKQAGQTRVEAGGHVFILQRPTLAEIYVGGGQRISIDFVAAHVVGWENVKESDLIAGGDPEPLAFDGALCAAWLEDRFDLWTPLTEALVASFKQHEEAQAARGKP